MRCSDQLERYAPSDLITNMFFNEFLLYFISLLVFPDEWKQSNNVSMKFWKKQNLSKTRTTTCLVMILKNSENTVRFQFYFKCCRAAS